MSTEEEIKQKKLEELKQQYLRQQQEEQKQAEVEGKIQLLLKQALDEDARARLNNVRLVNQELYMKTFQSIMQMAQKGYLKGKLNEEQLKEILRQLKNNREINIERK